MVTRNQKPTMNTQKIKKNEYKHNTKRIDDMLGHKRILNQFKKTEIMSSIFLDHNVMRLEINYKKKECQKHKHVEAN